MRHRLFCLLIVSALSFQTASAAETKAETPFNVSPQWAGAWEFSPAANQLLGFAGEEDRKNANFDHPLSFTLSFDETLGTSTNSKSVDGYQETVFKDALKQRVVATGIWKMKFDVDPGFDEQCCFLTAKEGSTYLWKPAAYVVVYGGKISFIEGVDKSKDLLVIDFNPHESKFPRHETVVYQRAVGAKHIDQSKSQKQK